MFFHLANICCACLCVRQCGDQTDGWRVGVGKAWGVAVEAAGRFGGQWAQRVGLEYLSQGVSEQKGQRGGSVLKVN